jgi:two-component system cell cycle response regulator
MSACIVIVDRAATGRIMLRAMLARAAHEVMVCDDLADVAALMAARPVDIIIADAAEVRALATARATFPSAEAPLIVALTRADDPRARITALQAGADDVLSRDMGEALVLSTLRRLLRQRTALRDSVIAHDVATAGFAEAQTPFSGPTPDLIEDATGPITVISTRPGALPRSIRMLIERHPGPIEVAATVAIARGEAAVYIVDGGGFARSADGRDALYATTVELDVRAKAERAATLVLVPDGAEHLGVMVLDLGSEEQVCETVQPEELSHRVRRLLRRKAQADRQRDRLQSTIAAASVDPLTGLYNLRHAEARLTALVEAARRHDQPLALLMLDVDRFKSINDTHGHPTGDSVLIAIARHLRDNLRAVDLLARVGGEEFLVAMPETSVDQARGAAERLRRIIATAPFLSTRMPPQRLAVTLSIGVAVGHPGGAGDRAQAPAAIIAGLRQRADFALYAAKADGRNKVTVAPPAPGMLT